MSKSLQGEHYCKTHQGNHSHYATHNCAVCNLKEEVLRLRTVYEAARRFLRYNGIDRDKVNAAVDELDSAVESVKALGSGQSDDT